MTFTGFQAAVARRHVDEFDRAEEQLQKLRAHGQSATGEQLQRVPTCGPSATGPLAEQILAVLAEADTDPVGGFPRCFTYRELAMIAYDTPEPTTAQLSSIRRVAARLIDAQLVDRVRRRPVEIRRPMTDADWEDRREALRPFKERAEATANATAYPIDASDHGGIVEVQVEPVLIIRESGVELREAS